MILSKNFSITNDMRRLDSTREPILTHQQVIEEGRGGIPSVNNISCLRSSSFSSSHSSPSPSPY